MEYNNVNTKICKIQEKEVRTVGKNLQTRLECIIDTKSSNESPLIEGIVTTTKVKLLNSKSDSVAYNIVPHLKLKHKFQDAAFLFLIIKWEHCEHKIMSLILFSSRWSCGGAMRHEEKENRRTGTENICYIWGLFWKGIWTSFFWMCFPDICLGTAIFNEHDLIFNKQG